MSDSGFFVLPADGAERNHGQLLPLPPRFALLRVTSAGQLRSSGTAIWEKLNVDLPELPKV